MTLEKMEKTNPERERIKNAIQRAYRFGFKEGLNEGEKRLNCMRATNHYLWKELVKLDRHQPDEGILLSLSFAEKLVEILTKKRSSYAKKLRKLIQMHNRKLDRFLTVLNSCKREK